MTPLGVQWTAELYGCDPEILDDVARIEAAMVDAATVARATLVTRSFHKFAPQGVSGVLVIAESHIAIHTWPELGYAALDVFTCGDRLLAEAGFQHLAERLGAARVESVRLHRGDPKAIEAWRRPA